MKLVSFTTGQAIKIGQIVMRPESDRDAKIENPFSRREVIAVSIGNTNFKLLMTNQEAGEFAKSLMETAAITNSQEIV